MRSVPRDTKTIDYKSDKKFQSRPIAKMLGKMSYFVKISIMDENVVIIGYSRNSATKIG